MAKRRSFLKSLIYIPLIGGLAVKKLRGSADGQDVLINTFSVAGFQFYDGPRLIDQMKIDDRLHLKAEPENVYDDFAVKIVFREQHIGYVPRSDNRHISRMLQQNVPLVCRISEIDPDEDHWQMLKVRVYLKGSSV